MSYPYWWDTHGMSMMLGNVDTERLTLLVSARTARLDIQALTEPTYWRVSWSIRRNLQAVDSGLRDLEGHELAAAFGLEATRSSYRPEISQRFGTTDMIPGMYIRMGDFLCLPGPRAVDSSPDSWISLELSSDIRNAVKSLLEARRRLQT